jgi:hypothetical protein
MKINFIKSQSSVYPELIDTTSSKKYVYIRQNVVEVQSDEIDGETYTYYEYDEAKLTKEEYEQYLKEIGSAETLESIETLKAENAMLTETVDMLTACILEMSELVYA